MMRDPLRRLRSNAWQLSQLLRQASDGAGRLHVSKSEIRISKSETNSKSEKSIQTSISAFKFRVCFGFRNSNFGFSCWQLHPRRQTEAEAGRHLRGLFRDGLARLLDRLVDSGANQ